MSGNGNPQVTNDGTATGSKHDVLELLAGKETSPRRRPANQRRPPDAPRSDAHGTQAVRKVMSKVLWLEVTQDEFELPVAVAGDQHELARMRGVTPEHIKYNWYAYMHGRTTRCKYRRVEVEE